MPCNQGGNTRLSLASVEHNTEWAIAEAAASNKAKRGSTVRGFGKNVEQLPKQVDKKNRILAGTAQNATAIDTSCSEGSSLKKLLHICSYNLVY